MLSLGLKREPESPNGFPATALPAEGGADRGVYFSSPCSAAFPGLKRDPGAGQTAPLGNALPARGPATQGLTRDAGKHVLNKWTPGLTYGMGGDLGNDPELNNGTGDSDESRYKNRFKII